MAPVPKAAVKTDSGAKPVSPGAVKGPEGRPNVPGVNDVPMELRGGPLMPNGGVQPGLPGAMPVNASGGGPVIGLPQWAANNATLTHVVGDGLTPRLPGGVCPMSHSMPYRNAGPGGRNRFEIMPDMKNPNAQDGLLYTPPQGATIQVLRPDDVNAAAELEAKIHVAELFIASGQIPQPIPQQLQQHLDNLRAQRDALIADALVNAGIIPNAQVPIGQIPERDELINFLQHVGLSYRQKHLTNLAKAGGLTPEEHTELQLIGDTPIPNGDLPPGRLIELEQDGMPGVLVPITQARVNPPALLPQPVVQPEQPVEVPSVGPDPGDIPVERTDEPLKEPETKKEEPKQAPRPPQVPRLLIDFDAGNFFRHSLDILKAFQPKPQPPAKKENEKVSEEKKPETNNSGAPKTDAPKVETPKLEEPKANPVANNGTNNAGGNTPPNADKTNTGSAPTAPVPKDFKGVTTIQLVEFGGTPIDIDAVPKGVDIRQPVPKPFEPPLEAAKLTPDEYKEVTALWMGHLRTKRNERPNGSTFGSDATQLEVSKLFIKLFKEKGLTPNNTPRGVEAARIYLLLQDEANELAAKRDASIKRTKSVLAGKEKLDVAEWTKLMTGSGKKGVGIPIKTLNPGSQVIIEKSPGLENLVNDGKDSLIPYDAVALVGDEGRRSLSKPLLASSSTGLGVSGNGRHRVELTMLIVAIEDAEKKGDVAKASALHKKLLEHPVVQKTLEKAEAIRTTEINTVLEKRLQMTDEDVADHAILSQPRPKVAEKPRHDVHFDKADYEKHADNLKKAFAAAKQAGDIRGMAILWNGYIAPLSEYPPPGVSPIHLSLDQADINLIAALPPPKPQEVQAYRLATLMLAKERQDAASRGGSSVPANLAPDAIAQTFGFQSTDVAKEIETVMRDVASLSPADRLIFIDAFATRLNPPGARPPGQSNMDVVRDHLLANSPPKTAWGYVGDLTRGMHVSTTDVAKLVIPRSPGESDESFQARAAALAARLDSSNPPIGRVSYQSYLAFDMLYHQRHGSLTPAEMTAVSVYLALNPNAERQWANIANAAEITSPSRPDFDPGVRNLDVLYSRANGKEPAQDRPVTLHVAIPVGEASTYSSYSGSVNYAVPNMFQVVPVTYSPATNNGGRLAANPTGIFSLPTGNVYGSSNTGSNHAIGLRTELVSMVASLQSQKPGLVLNDALRDAELTLTEIDGMSSADATARLTAAIATLNLASQSGQAPVSFGSAVRFA